MHTTSKTPPQSILKMRTLLKKTHNFKQALAKRLHVESMHTIFLKKPAYK